MSVATETHQSIQTTDNVSKLKAKLKSKTLSNNNATNAAINGHTPSKKASKWAKQKQKRKRRQQRKKNRKAKLSQQEQQSYKTKSLLNESQKLLGEIEYISDTLTETAKNNFSKAFERFTPAEDLFKTREQLLKEALDKERIAKLREKEEKEKLRREDPIEAAIPSERNEENEKKKKEKEESHKMRKLRTRPSIAQLKKTVLRSDLVEEHDVNAANPWLLIKLKSMRNTVPVPSHWLQKRKYLQGKRGFLKPAFKLPSYIEATGITKMRENRLTLLSDKSMKQKQRERVRPKKGGLEIAYSILHEAFFRHQTKPQSLSRFGDLYYEGKEFLCKFSRFKPGFTSDNLKKALGMTARYRVVSPGGVIVQNKKENTETNEMEWYNVSELKYGQFVVWDSDVGTKRIKISAPVSGYVWLSSKDNKEELLKRCDVEDPPPWLINMQRFGPPPSYPDLKIPGLNAPIPTHKMYGFHDGQWGKPPVDENGQPLYGNPFGIWCEPISKSWKNKSRWGVLQKYESDTESESEEDEEEEESEAEEDTQRVTAMAVDSGVMSEVSSVGEIDLRKGLLTIGGIDTPMSGISTEEGRELYQVLQEKENAVSGKFGSSMVYTMPAGKRKNGTGKGTEQQPPAKKRRQV